MNSQRTSLHWRCFARSLCIAATMFMSLSLPVSATSIDQPWLRSDAIIVIDPYEDNSIDWDKVAQDQRVKAVIHRASIGTREDTAFAARSLEAKKRGLRWGAYHLGHSGDPIEQADLFLSLANKTGATFLALDIEDIGGINMPLADAAKFVEHVHQITGRYPALYVNRSVATTISERYSRDSVFSKTPLWLAVFRKALPPLESNVWTDVTLWQFGSEWNCPEATRKKRKDELCIPYRPYNLAGTRYDMDINVLLDAASLEQLFGSAPMH